MPAEYGFVLFVVALLATALLLPRRGPFPNSRAAIDLAWRHMRAGEYGEAIALLDRAVESFPHDALVVMTRGNCYTALGRFDEAVRDLDRAATLIVATGTAFDVAHVHYNRAVAHAVSGNFVKAAADLEQVLALDEEYSDAKSELVWILATAPDDSVRSPDRALELAQQVESEGTLGVSQLDSIAAAYAATGQFDKAIKTMEQGLEMASELERDLLQSRLAAYQQQTPYIQTVRDRELGGLRVILGPQ